MKCIICSNELELNNGIIICNKGMCTNCESRLLNLGFIDTDFYNFYIKSISNNLSPLILQKVYKKSKKYNL